MTSRFRLLVPALLCLPFSALLPAASAQDAAPAPAGGDPASHPAAKVAMDYHKAIMTRQWKASADIVDEGSMRTLQLDYVNRIKSARTMDEEERMARRVGKSTPEEVEKMTPREWYSAFNEGLKEDYKVDEAKLEMIRKTVVMKVLAAVEENAKTAHVLVRAKYSTGEHLIERLELVTLVKNDASWKISLDGQAPKATPIDGAGAARPSADPVNPPADPVKPAKPAPAKPAPVKPKPKTR